MHVCELNALNDPFCSCNAGYELDGNEKACNPHNACDDGNGGCKQVCVNDGPGLVHCACKEGFVLMADKLSCQISEMADIKLADSDSGKSEAVNIIFVCVCFQYVTAMRA